MNRRRREFIKQILTAINGMAIVFSFIISYSIRTRLTAFGFEALLPFSRYFPYMVLVIIVWLLLLKLFKNYSYIRIGIRKPSRGSFFVNLLAVEIIGLAIISMILFFLRDVLISRSFLVLFAGVDFVLLLSIKLIVMTYFRRVEKTKKYTQEVLIVGNRGKINHFKKIRKDMPELMIDVIEVPEFITDEDCPISGIDFNAFGDRVMNYIWTNVVDEILIAFSDLEVSLLSGLLNECSKQGVGVNILVDTTGIDFKKTEIDSLGSLNILTFQSYDYSPNQRFLKRLTDIVLGLAGFFVFLVLAIFIAPIIKITSPGPVMFRQNRMGKNGRIFKLYKFRSMQSDAEAQKKGLEAQNEMQGHIFKVKNDPRITTFGRFLRKSSLDEFPQFINILKGDMSLVGTRPPTVDEYDEYEPHHRRRMSIRPGLTGLWQVSGRNKISDFEEVVKLDTKYIDNWSLWLDIKILFKTFIVLFSGR